MDLTTRILIVWPSDYPHIGGVSTHIDFLVKGLKEKGFDVKVLSHNGFFKVMINGPSFILRKFSRNLGGIYYLVSTIFVYGIASNVIIRLLRINTIFAEHPLAAISIVKIRNGKLIQIVHTYLTRELIIGGIVMSETWTSNLFRRLENRSYLKSDRIIAVDSRLKEHIISESRVKPNNVDVILNSIDTEKFSPVSNDEKNRIRKELAWPLDSFIIFCPRRLVEKCGVAYPLIALTKIEKYYRDRITLIFAGDGPEKNKLLEIAEMNNLKNVLLLGLVKHDKIDLLFKASDAVIVPSVNVGGLEEASSFSAIEGMSCGLPVIASDIGGLKEIIVDGVTGILVPEKNPDAIASAYRSLMGDLKFYQEISMASRSIAVEKYSSNIKLEEYIRIAN